MFTVSDVVRNNAAVAGAEGWIDGLPDLVATLGDEWEFSPIRPLSGGTESFVVEVRRADGTTAVLKLVIPRDFDAAGNEITVLQLADGDGCPRLFAHDRTRGALLMERLGRPMSELSIPLQRRHEILCSAAARLWRPAPPECSLATGPEKGARLIDFITTKWEALDPRPAVPDHHHCVHEGGYNLDRSRTGVISVTRPDGTALPQTGRGRLILEPDEPDAPPGTGPPGTGLTEPAPTIPAHPGTRFRTVAERQGAAQREAKWWYQQTRTRLDALAADTKHRWPDQPAA